MLLLSTLDRLVIGHSIRVELEHLPQVVVTISRDWVCQGSAQGSGEQSVVANVQKAKVRKSKAKSAKSKRKKQQRRNKTVVDLDVAAVAATTTTVGRYRWFWLGLTRPPRALPPPAQLPLSHFPVLFMRMLAIYQVLLGWETCLYY